MQDTRPICGGVLRPSAKGCWVCAHQSRSLVRIAGNKSDLSPAHVGQSCPLSPVLLIICGDRIFRGSHGPKGVWFGAPQDFIAAFCR